MALDIGRRRLAREIATARDAGRPTPGVVIVGAGLSGLAFAIQLVRSGTRDFAIVEQSDGVGGTWRDNTYPGSGCDVPSHFYSLSFFPKSDWTRRFADQPEILSYAERCVDRFELGPHLRLGTTVQRAEFDEAQHRWRLILASAGGEERDHGRHGDLRLRSAQPPPCTRPSRPWGLHRAHVAFGPMGPRMRPGRQTGRRGRQRGERHPVRPAGGRAGRALTIYQRSPELRGPEEGPALPGPDPMAVRERARHRARLPVVDILGPRVPVDMVPQGQLGRPQAAAQLFAREIRAAVVSDRLPEESVVPDYPVGCKRILISNDWYPTLMRSTVEVVDRPIDHIEAGTVVTSDGKRRPADVLIFGTGFSTTDFLAHIPVTGEGDAPWPGSGTTDPTPTWEPRYRAFPTATSSTGPTPTWATI